MTDWLLTTLLAISGLMLLVLLIREPVRRRFGSRVAYGLWLIPAARLLMPTLTETVQRTVPATGPVRPLVRSVVDEPHLMNISPAGPSLLEQIGGWPTVLLIVWLGVALGFFLSRITAFQRDRNIILARGHEVGRIGSIRIVQSAEVPSPIAFGIFDRVIAVPAEFDRLYDERERGFALDHELAHHRSGDLIANYFAFVLLCLQWFNPLAWVAHAAFRFDQEAACDARVLDQGRARDRADYGRAIAKAASGRTLLFAGALDRPGALQRRLRSMLTSPSAGRRVAGNALIALTVAAALPLTASRATEYFDVPAPQSVAASSVVAAAVDPSPPHASPGIVSAVAATAPNDTIAALNDTADAGLPIPDLGGITFGKNDVAFFEDDTVLISGKRKRLDQLTAPERSRLRAVILKSQREQARERAELPRRLAEAKREADRARSGELKRRLMRDREDLRRDLARIDSEAAELRADGEDPEKRKAEIRQDLREAEAVDIDQEEREAIEDNDPNKIIAELRAEEAQMARMLARLGQLDRR